MIKARYNKCEHDSCVYFKKSDDPTYLMLYVNDMLIAARNKTHFQKLKVQLKKKLDMKDLREVKKILRMEITRDRCSSRLWLSQENHILKMLERLNMAEARPITTLLVGHFKLSSRQCLQSPKEEEKFRVPYASEVGSSCMLCSAPGLT